MIKAFAGLLVSLVKGKSASSVTVIGGADGPTSIFLAGKIPDRSMTGAVVIGIIVLLLVVFFLWQRKRRSGKE